MRRQSPAARDLGAVGSPVWSLHEIPLCPRRERAEASICPASSPPPFSGRTDVRISAKVDYAVRAAIELAAAPNEKPICAERLATAQGIPLNFLENILSELDCAAVSVSATQPSALSGDRPHPDPQVHTLSVATHPTTLCVQLQQAAAGPLGSPYVARRSPSVSSTTVATELSVREPASRNIAEPQICFCGLSHRLPVLGQKILSRGSCDLQ